VPPSRWGGNMDTKHLRAGTTLYLPVGVEGALFSVVDAPNWVVGAFLPDDIFTGGNA
jgi:acetamidase/formamidase